MLTLQFRGRNLQSLETKGKLSTRNPAGDSKLRNGLNASIIPLPAANLTCGVSCIGDHGQPRRKLMRLFTIVSKHNTQLIVKSNFGLMTI